MVDLTKRAQTAGVVLAKKGLASPPVLQVGFNIDISGSMSDEFADGSVQKVMDQLHGIAMKFDDDGSFQVFKFDDKADYVGECGQESYGKYIRESKITVRGGTAYSPFIKLITEHYFPAKSGGFGGLFKKPQSTSNTPVLILTITDGAPMSEGYRVEDQLARIRPALVAAQNHPIYWHFVGINNQGEQFEVLQKLADDLPNVGFIKMNNFNKSDEELYNEVLCDELIQWVKQVGRNTATASA